MVIIFVGAMGCFPAKVRRQHNDSGEDGIAGDGFVTAMEITDATYKVQCGESSQDESDDSGEAATESLILATKDEALLRQKRVAALRGRLVSLAGGAAKQDAGRIAAATHALGEMEKLASRKGTEARALDVVWRFRRVVGEYTEQGAARERFFIWRGHMAQTAAPRPLVPRLRLVG